MWRAYSWQKVSGGGGNDELLYLSPFICPFLPSVPFPFYVLWQRAEATLRIWDTCRAVAVPYFLTFAVFSFSLGFSFKSKILLCRLNTVFRLLSSRNSDLPTELQLNSSLFQTTSFVLSDIDAENEEITIDSIFGEFRVRNWNFELAVSELIFSVRSGRFCCQI